MGMGMGTGTDMCASFVTVLSSQGLPFAIGCQTTATAALRALAVGG